VVVFGLQDSRQKMKFSKLRPGGLQRKRKDPGKVPRAKNGLRCRFMNQQASVGMPLPNHGPGEGRQKG
jgi:hypothetical protein